VTTGEISHATDLADMIAESFAGERHPHVRAALYLLERADADTQVLLAARAALVSILRPTTR